MTTLINPNPPVLINMAAQPTIIITQVPGVGPPGVGAGGGINSEQAVDAVAAALAAGANITIDYNDPLNTITVAAPNVVSNVRGVTGIWSGSQAEYDAIPTKVATVFYIIV